MNVAIIGAGNVGTALATAFARAGHDVVIASRDAEDAAAASAASGARIAASNVDAAQAGDVIVLAVWIDSVGRHRRRDRGHRGRQDHRRCDQPDHVRRRTARRSIRPPRTPRTVAALFPASHVVKAFNTLFACRQVDPILDGETLDGVRGRRRRLGEGAGSGPGQRRSASSPSTSARSSAPASWRASPSSTWPSISTTVARGSPAGSSSVAPRPAGGRRA